MYVAKQDCTPIMAIPIWSYQFGIAKSVLPKQEKHYVYSAIEGRRNYRCVKERDPYGSVPAR